jgi:monoamine oxidase
MSVLCLDQGPWPDDYATLSYKIAGGKDLLPRGLAAHLGERIQLGCEVVAVDQTTHDVAVGFRRGRESDVVSAAHVVLAVPVPGLRRITFAPPLPLEKTAALRRELEPVISQGWGTPERVITTDWMGDAYAGGGWLVYPLQPHAA